jgi:hypothetical protein
MHCCIAPIDGMPSMRVLSSHRPGLRFGSSPLAACRVLVRLHAASVKRSREGVRRRVMAAVKRVMEILIGNRAGGHKRAENSKLS